MSERVTVENCGAGIRVIMPKCVGGACGISLPEINYPCEARTVEGSLEPGEVKIFDVSYGPLCEETDCDHNG